MTPSIPAVDTVTDLDPVHMIAIGGVGMSALAKILLARGVRVSGSDIKDGPGLAALRALGARVEIGHSPKNLEKASSVVISSAIRPNNPELQAARERGLLVLHRAQLLALLMRGSRGIAVAGTHGKTTTTSMIAIALLKGGLDPTFLIGGDLNEPGTNAYHGSGEWLLAEADESDGSFLWLLPEIAVVTNIEAEHLDHYRDEADVRDTFAAFMGNVASDGTIVACEDDAGVRAVLPLLGRPAVTYGLEHGRWRGAREPDGTLHVSLDGRALGSVKLDAPGAHNARNALAAIATADSAGVPFRVAADAIASFSGPQRRFQLRGIAAGVSVVDEYAHNPTKVRAALQAARERARGRVIAVFQPHLYSRTRIFGRALGDALSAADLVVVMDVYGAREDPEPGVTGKLVVDGVLASDPRKRVAYLPKRGEIPGYIAARVRDGDMVLTIGAGDVTMLGDQILRAIEGSRP